MLPFEHHGEIQHQCLPYPGNLFWCPTKIDHKLEHIEGTDFPELISISQET